MKKLIYRGNTVLGFNSPHKTFNKAVSRMGFGVGNVCSDVQHSSYIRPSQELECNGRINELGHLQKFDLDSFKSRLSGGILHSVGRLADLHNGVILYHVFYYDRNERKSLGAVVTDENYNFLQSWCHALNWKAEEAFYMSIDYMAERAN